MLKSCWTGCCLGRWVVEQAAMTSSRQSVPSIMSKLHCPLPTLRSHLPRKPSAPPSPQSAPLPHPNSYLNGVFYPVIYTGAAFNGAYHPEWFMGQLVKVGSVRIGTLRVDPQDCPAYRDNSFDMIPDNIKCYPRWSTETDSAQAFGKGLVFT